MTKSQILVVAGVVGLLPYVAGIVTALLKWQFLPLALIGILIMLLCTTGAYILRKQNKPKYAAQRLIVDPFLYTAEFAMSAVLVHYVILRGH
jgi:hypothetical protein